MFVTFCECKDVITSLTNAYRYALIRERMQAGAPPANDEELSILASQIRALNAELNRQTSSFWVEELSMFMAEAETQMELLEMQVLMCASRSRITHAHDEREQIRDTLYRVCEQKGFEYAGPLMHLFVEERSRHTAPHERVNERSEIR